MSLASNKILITLLLCMFIFPSSKLSITQNKIIFSDISEEDLNRGYKTADFTFLTPLGINIESQSKWALYIKPNHLMFSSTAGINIDHIQWKKSGQTDEAYKPLRIEKQLITSNNRDNYIELNFRINVSWLTPPNAYFFPVYIILEESKIFSKKRIRKIK